MEALKQLQQKEIELQNYTYQRQSLELQLNEINSALDELKNVDYGYELIANIMVKKPAEKIKEKLNEKKDLISFKIESLKKIEQKIRQEMDELREKVKTDLR